MSEYLPFLGFLDYNTKAAMRNRNAGFESFMDHVISEREKDTVVVGKDLARDILDVLLLPENKLSRGVIKALIMVSEMISLILVQVKGERFRINEGEMLQKNSKLKPTQTSSMYTGLIFCFCFLANTPGVISEWEPCNKQDNRPGDVRSFV